MKYSALKSLSIISIFCIFGFSFMACDRLQINQPPKTDATNEEFITANRTSGPAPLAVIFDAISLRSTRTNRPFHDLRYRWDFGDTEAAGSNWIYGAKPGTVNKNTDAGAIAGHLFQSPGNYTVTMTSFDGVDQFTSSVTITVTDPNIAYSGINTICIGQSSVPLAADPGVPPGAKCVQAKIWNDVIIQVLPGQRIMLRRGDTWDVSSLGKVALGNSPFPTRIEAFGTGAAPILQISTNTNPFWLNNPQSTYEFFNLNFVGTDNVGSVGINGNGKKGIVVVGCTMDLVGSPLKLGGNDLFIQDNNFQDMLSRSGKDANYTGRGNLGIWIANSERVAILGNRINNATAIEHVIRTQGAGRAVYAHNSLAGPAISKHALALRGKVDPQSLTKTWPYMTEYILVQDNLIESGLAPTDRLVQVGPQASEYQEVIQDMILEGNRLSGSYTTGIFSEVSGRLTVRNNLFYNTNTTSSVGLSIGYTNINGVPPNSESRFDHNSLYFMGNRASGAQQYTVLTSQPSGLVVRGNLLYAPNAASNSLGNGVPSIYAGNVPDENYQLGVNSTNTQIMSSPPWVVLPPLTLNDWKPTAGCYAIDSGLAVPVWEYFSGELRTGTYDLGALQP